MTEAPATPGPGPDAGRSRGAPPPGRGENLSVTAARGQSAGAAAAGARHGKGAEDKSKTPPEWRGWAGKRVTAVLDRNAAGPGLPAVISGAVVETAFDHWVVLRWGARRLILNKRYIIAGIEEA